MWFISIYILYDFWYFILMTDRVPKLESGGLETGKVDYFLSGTFE